MSLLLPLALMPSLTTAAVQIGPPEVRQRLSFDTGWRFKRDDAPGTSVNRAELVAAELPTSNPFIQDASHRYPEAKPDFGADLPYARPDFDDRDWSQLDLPHDWAMAGPFTHVGGGGMGRLPTSGVGWYRKSFDLAAADVRRRVFLDVDGAMSHAVVWLNGAFVGGWSYGYASWRLDLGPYLHSGKNVLAVRLDNPQNFSRWYPGAGIYRHVWLVETEPVHVAHWGTRVTTANVSSRSADINLKVAVQNDTTHDSDLRVATDVFALDLNGRRAGRASAAMPAVDLRVPAGQSASAAEEVTLKNPRLWGPPPVQKPNRYLAVTTVSDHGAVVDRYETPFGVRSILFTPANGLLVNGKRVNLQGVCDHHDLGALGAALNDRALHRQIDELIEMGCNAIRTSHNPPAPELLEYADRRGVMVMDEFVNVWQAQKTPNDYHRLFNDWHEQDLRALIERDRNHPSVIMWSIGNEVGEQFRGEPGARIARMLSGIAHEEDPTRPTTAAMNAARADSPFPLAVNLIGLNYQGTGVRAGQAQYPVFHERYPDKFVYGSETTSALSSRGEYTFPVAPGTGVPASSRAGEDTVRHHVSSYDLYSAPWSYAPDREFTSQDQWPYVGGEFVWTGWDYLGEPTPFDSSRSSYFGIIDLAGFKKDRFYLYQAHWRPDLPMAHILPHWTWPEREGLKDADGKPVPTPVHVYTSGDEGELFLNGKSLGRSKKGKFEYRLRWDDVIYEPGTLKVVTYKNGRPWATDEVSTAGAAARLTLIPDRRRIAADGKDLCFVTVVVQDAQGRTVPRAHPRISFTVDGPGQIVATDNGDPTDFDSFASTSRQAFNGLALVIVRPIAGQPGRIRIRAVSDGLLTATVAVDSR